MPGLNSVVTVAKTRTSSLPGTLDIKLIARMAPPLLVH
jgi:hypothetical protein